MELNDIVYFLLMLVFVVFGIFNDSKKKKKKIDKSTEPINKELKDVLREIFQNPDKQQLPPPVPKTVFKNKKKTSPSLNNSNSKGFQSSMNLITDFEGESALNSSIYSAKMKENDSEMENVNTVHPVVEQLKNDDTHSEIRKAIIYSEILKRKY